MIRINLLPPSEQKREFRSARIFKTLTLIIMAVQLTVLGWQVFNCYSVNQDLVNLERRQAELQPVQQIMDTGNSQLKSVGAKTEIIHTLTGQIRPWQQMMQHFSAITSDRVWLREVGNANEKEKDTIHVIGSAVNNDAVAVFLQQLERDSFFKDTFLVKVEQDEKLGVMNFQIQFKGVVAGVGENK